jgi:toxin secretion/phage lysis holin
MAALAFTEAAPSASVLHAGLGVVFAFFQTQLLAALMAFLLIDLMTGLWKAKLLKKTASNRLGNAIDRMVFYIIVYSVLHGLTLVVPLGALASLPETFVMTGYVLKEALSILENLKVIQFIKGESTPIIDALITRLGMDIDRIVKEILSESATQLPEHVIAQVPEHIVKKLPPEIVAVIKETVSTQTSKEFGNGT